MKLSPFFVKLLDTLLLIGAVGVFIFAFFFLLAKASYQKVQYYVQWLPRW